MASALSEVRNVYLPCQDRYRLPNLLQGRLVFGCRDVFNKFFRFWYTVVHDSLTKTQLFRILQKSIHLALGCVAHYRFRMAYVNLFITATRVWRGRMHVLYIEVLP